MSGESKVTYNQGYNDGYKVGASDGYDAGWIAALRYTEGYEPDIDEEGYRLPTSEGDYE